MGQANRALRSVVLSIVIQLFLVWEILIHTILSNASGDEPPLSFRSSVGKVPPSCTERLTVFSRAVNKVCLVWLYMTRTPRSWTVPMVTWVLYTIPVGLAGWRPCTDRSVAHAIRYTPSSQPALPCSTPVVTVDRVSVVPHVVNKLRSPVTPFQTSLRKSVELSLLSCKQPPHS